MNKLVIVGAGGAGAETLWIVRRINAAGAAPQWDILGFADDNPLLHGTMVDGVPVLGSVEQLIHERGDARRHFHCAIGNNGRRRRVVERLEAAGWLPATLIDPTAIIADSVVIGAGSYVGPLSVFAPHARVGRHVLLNSHTAVGHHATVADYAQLCPAASANGGSKIGRGAFLGNNVVIHPGATVGEDAVVCAGSFVVGTVKPGYYVMGIPARVVRRPAAPATDKAI